MTFPSLSPEFIRAFSDRADGNGILRFDRFVDLALYDPSMGYYRRDRQRVGYAPGTDFFTSATSSEVFGELVSAACTEMLGNGKANEYTFVEIGAESEAGILEGIAHPFRACRTVRLGGELDLQGPLVVFSNELFDAQPFRRFRFLDDRWRELGVILHDGALSEIVLTDAELPSIGFPVAAPEGYTIDAPIAAAKLIHLIARQPWRGLFVAIDYGKPWQELIEATPAGTARAYFRHTQSNDLLARPGEQDLTCHVCWDWLNDALQQHGFAAPKLETQEAFFIRHAGSYLAPAIQQDAARHTRRKQSLIQLLHGAHLGQKFQALHAFRGESAGTKPVLSAQSDD